MKETKKKNKKNRKNKKKNKNSEKGKMRAVISASALVLIGIIILLSLFHNTNDINNAKTITETVTAPVVPTPTPVQSQPQPTQPTYAGGFAINDSLVPPPPAPTAAVGNVIIAIALQEDQVKRGDTFTVELEVNPNGNSIAGVQLDFNYTYDKLTIEDIEKGSDFSWFYVLDKKNQPGVRTIVGIFPPNATATTAFDFARIKMKATAAGTAAVGISKAIVVDSDGMQYPVEVKEKSIPIT